MMRHLDVGRISFLILNLNCLLSPRTPQDTKNFEFDEWNGVASTPYLATFMPEAEAEAVTRAYLARAVEDAEREAAANAPELEEGEELCNCEFSLAYGAKILLNNAHMRLLRGHRWVPDLGKWGVGWGWEGGCVAGSGNGSTGQGDCLWKLSAAWPDRKSGSRSNWRAPVVVMGHVNSWPSNSTLTALLMLPVAITHQVRPVRPQRCGQVHPDARHCQWPGGRLPPC